VLSGVYFLFLPSGGYKGGRNPMYGVTILFERHTWKRFTPGAAWAMIVVAVVHLAVHWRGEDDGHTGSECDRTRGAGLSKERG